MKDLRRNCFRYLFPSAALKVAFAVSLVAQAAGPVPMEIPQVRTCGDLLAAPLIGKENMGGRDSVPVPRMHVGIDHRTAGLYGGVVLYLLIESPVPASFLNTIPSGEERLGPFPLRVEGPVAKEVLDQYTTQSPQLREMPEGHRLFMKTIPLSRPGKWKISLLSLGSMEPFATAEVIVGKEIGTVWMPWQETGADQKWVEREGENSFAVNEVGNPKGGFAIPSFSNDVSLSVPLDIDHKQLLPVLFPSEVAANTSIRAETSLLTVKIDRPHGITFPPDQFLTRWWINGEPIGSNLEPEVDLMASLDGGRVFLVDQFQFSIRFDAKVYGAREGDVIGLQLLFCPFGWNYSANMVAEMPSPAVSAEQVSDGLSLLLPRTEFLWKDGALRPKAEGGGNGDTTKGWEERNK